MMVQRNKMFGQIDYLSILLWLLMLGFGWMNIYSASIMESENAVFDLSMRYGKQVIWVAAALGVALLIMLVDAKVFLHFSYIFYGFIILVLMAVLVIGTEINGAKSWIVIGGFQIQPSEFAKPFTALALANLMSTHNFQIRRIGNLFRAAAIIALPPLLIILQPDLGSVLVYAAFLLVLFREGFSANTMALLAVLAVLFIVTLLLDKALLLLLLVLAGLLIHLFMNRSFKRTLLIGLLGATVFGVALGINQITEEAFSLFTLGLISAAPLTLYFLIVIIRKRSWRELRLLAGLIISLGFIVSVDFAMNEVLKPHQRHRLTVTLGIEDDPTGIGYNLAQSKIAIGSGGVKGKGFLQGTQTKLDFVPEQETDFIFCTVGEEWGFLGTTFVVLLYAGFILRMLFLAERQRSAFSRIFGYGFIAVMLFHFMINIGMTIGLMPVIGIPLPFFSYGGSSLWAFTIFLFIFLRLDASRYELLR